MSAEETKKLQVLQNFQQNLSAYSQLQATTPRIIGHALADSPAGQLAWSCQLFGNAVSNDFIITNVMLYWLTNTGLSSARFYYEDTHASDVPKEPTTIPIGLANFAYDFQSFRSLAERDHKNIISWNVYDQGGHFPTKMTPDLYVKDLREFASKLQSTQR
jgi:hypothetical protein